MTNIGHFVRDQLAQSEATSTQIYQEWRDVRPRHGTAQSFATFVSRLKTLGWVEDTGETLPPPQPGMRPAKMLRLTAAGENASFQDWADPIGVLYPKHAASERGAKPPTGNPPGRPKKTLQPTS